MFNNNDIRNLLGIQDPNIQFDDNCTRIVTVNHKKVLEIHGILTYTPKVCQKCGVINKNDTIHKHGTQCSKITMVSASGQPTYLHLRKQRFKCQACHSTFTAQTSLVDKHCFISNRAKVGMVIEATEAVSIKSIAKRFYTSWHTVQRQINEAASTAMPTYPSLPKHLSFDEFKVKKGQLSFDYINAKTGQILGILSDTRQRTLKKHFTNRYSLKQRQAVQTITMDMNAGYIHLIKELFPNAAIIIDRFHLVQLLNRSLNKTRVQLMNRLKSNSDDKKKWRRLKRYWRLFLKAPMTLSYTTYQYYSMFGQRTESGIIEEMLQYDRTFSTNYHDVHRMLQAIHDNQFDALMDCLNQEPEGLSSYVKTSRKTLKKYAPYILNTFNYPYSNGRIEGIHNKIKVLNRVAYGYRNSGNYINRIALAFNQNRPLTSSSVA